MTPLLTHQPQIEFKDELAPHLIDHRFPDRAYLPSTMPEHLGQQYLATGYFSSVWAIPGEPFQVLKVSHRDSDACREYMEWCYANPHPAAPKIHSIEHHDHLMLVVMDKYEPFKIDWDKGSIEVPGERVLFGNKIADRTKPHEVLCATIRKIFSHHQFDLHENNVMLDRAGNVIITDPVSFSNGSDREDEEDE